MAGTNNSDGNDIVSGLDEHEMFIARQEIYDSYSLLAQTISISIASVLLFFGILGNVLSLIVWTNGPRCKVLSCVLYFKILALSDIFVLISYNASVFLRELYIFTNCKLDTLRLLLEQIGPQISPWIIVTLSVERTISIMFPLKCSRKPSKIRTWISFGCILIILAILHCLWMIRIKNSGITLAGCGDIMTKSELNIIVQLNLWVLAILPFSFIMVCNILILIQMFQMRKLKAATGRGRRTEVFATFTILTVVTGLLHCVSVIPTMLDSIASYQRYVYVYNFLQIELGQMFPDIFWNYFPRTMILFNNSLNFYVYCLAGRDFRKDLKHVFTCCSTRNNTRVQIV
jgi:hypothetical protein